MSQKEKEKERKKLELRSRDCLDIIYSSIKFYSFIATSIYPCLGVRIELCNRQIDKIKE